MIRGSLLLALLVGCARAPAGVNAASFWFGMSRSELIRALPEAQADLGDEMDGPFRPAGVVMAQVQAGAEGPAVLELPRVAVSGLMLHATVAQLRFMPEERARDAEAVFGEVREVGRKLDALGWKQGGAVMLDTLLRPEWFAVEAHCQVPPPPDNSVHWSPPEGGSWFEVTVSCERGSSGARELRWWLSVSEVF